ncbi:MAG: FAD-dependent oxidoreductase [Anaerotignum sp.]|nr:FAD-dependent oxidoreductase [Anaerotignum sp.]
MEHIYDVIIIGGGPGGYTAALYAARAGLDVLVLEKLSAGGQMALTSQIDNYPGFENGVDGFELAEKMQAGAERFGAKTELAEVYSAELKDKIKKINTSEGVFLAKTVVISTGASPRELGLEKEQALVGRGVNYCAACDGMFFRGKKVAVVGGGNSAAADALLLSRICEKVTVIHRRDALRATKIYHEPLMQAENVEFAWDSVVTDLIFEDGFRGVKLKNVKTEEERELSCDGMFYRGKTVVVVGGGNSAAADAMLLSRICEKVIVVHRRDILRATKIYHEPLMQAENVEFCWDSVLTELQYDDKFTGIRLKNVKTGEETDLPCDGVFISVGRKPVTEFLAGQLELDQAGYILADESTRTNIAGVFAVGDVRTKVLRQVVTAVSDGAMASHYIDEYLAEQM